MMLDPVWSIVIECRKGWRLLGQSQHRYAVPIADRPRMLSCGGPVLPDDEAVDRLAGGVLSDGPGGDRPAILLDGPRQNLLPSGGRVLNNGGRQQEIAGLYARASANPGGSCAMARGSRYLRVSVDGSWSKRTVQMSPLALPCRK